MLTDDEKKAREGALGSSDAAIVAGISRDKTPLTLYHQLRGDLPRYDDEETEAQKWGSRMQPIIAEVLAEDHGIKYRRCPLRIHKKYRFIVAHLDYEIKELQENPATFTDETACQRLTELKQAQWKAQAQRSFAPAGEDVAS